MTPTAFSLFFIPWVAPIPAVVVLVLALVIDRVAGDPKTVFHPVAVLGRLINLWGNPGKYPARAQRVAGVFFWIITVLLVVLPVMLYSMYAPFWLYLITAPFILKACIGWRSLEEHMRTVEGYAGSDLERARVEAGMMVSRNTTLLSEEQVLSAAYESGAENLTDSITAPLFWFAVLGLPGALLYRAANTMDAMLGYRDERERIGWFPARMDDILTFVPARLTGLMLVLWFCLKGTAGQAMMVFRRDRKKRPGFNGGITMSLIAGGTGVMFEKPGMYRIGNPCHSLRGAGKDIYSAIRMGALIFSFFVIATLLLWQVSANI